MTAKVKKMLSDLASLSTAELRELFGEALPALDSATMNRIVRFSAANTNHYHQGKRPPFNTGDLLNLLKDLPPDPAFADDIEAGIRARREVDESRTSTWES